MSIEIRMAYKPGPRVEDAETRELYMHDGNWYSWSERVPVWVADEIARLQRDSEALAVAKEALGRIGSGWKYPPGPGMRPPPEALGRDGMRREATDALSRISELQGASLHEKEG